MNNIPVTPGDVHNGFVGEGGNGVFANGTDRWAPVFPGSSLKSNHTCGKRPLFCCIGGAGGFKYTI
jgi:hypothetical protein